MARATVHPVSGIDAAFLYGETPSWHMHVSAVLLIDPAGGTRPFSFQHFRDHLAARIHLAPQFGWKLVEVPFGLGRPVFIDDPDFVVDAHLHRIGVPAPGGPEQVGNLIGDLVSRKLDRGKPLWEMWFIEGLAGGRVAILAKIHHAIVDGVSGSELATILMDLEPDPPPPVPPPARPEGAGLPEAEGLDGLELVLRSLPGVALTPVRAARFTWQTLRQGMRFVPFLQRATPPPVPFQAPRVSFNAELSPHRRFAYTSVSLDGVRTIKNHCGVKVNDVVLALCSGALRRYLLERGELPSSPLVAQVPVSMRTDGDRASVGTKVAAMFASLATNVADPLQRLLTIHEGTREAKEMQQALAAEKIMGFSETAPPVMIDLAARMYTAAGLDRSLPPVMNTIVSNVPGPSVPIWCAGSPIEALYPMGPLLYGTGLNITVFSYGDQVDFGFLVCRELVPEPWRLVEGVQAAMAELEAACETSRRGALGPDGSGLLP
jgi:diacylglycerol O-acyltransferase / wax synthase